LGDLTALGNATAVPVIIFLTQLLKKNIKFRNGSDLMALLLSLVVCSGWEIYNLTPEALQELSAGFVVKFRFVVDLIIVSFATWLAASKIYDLGHGSKKRSKKVETEKETLRTEIEHLKKNGNGDSNEKTVETPEISDKLRAILEER